MNDSRSYRTESQAEQTASTRRSRRRLLLTALVGGTVSLSSVGCASRSMSLASINPFKAKTAEAVTAVDETPGKLASTTGKVAQGTVTATKNVFQKASSRVTGLFAGKDETPEQDDPLALDNSPEKLEPDVFVANGQLWESTGNLTKAMESYQKALSASPNHEPALTSIARLHFRESNYPQAAEFFQKSIAQKPDDAALFNDLGLTLSKLGQHDMAAQTLQRALQIAPGTSRYANNLASVYFESNKADEALKVLQANNKPAVAHFNMAFLHYKKGQVAQAQAQLNLSLAHEKDSASDPATKRAISRSREMLAQISPGSALPNTGLPGVTPAVSPTGPIGPAAGPAATIAAAPAHRANQSPQVLGQQVIGSMTPQPKQPGMQPTVPGSTSPVSYQDPRSYMNPQVPAGAAPPSISIPSFGQNQTAAPAGVSNTTSSPNTSSFTMPPATQPAATATAPAAATPPSTSGFTLPGGFQLPASQ
ncbi:tetratricopeptide repeat protein [Neorhodopirellula pilleata]|uniref:Photosystem I assembly protein Ycf3 n=1 Tax=Neorhodopirellula pilleata TaxID=2714738 RepID=A0A5C6AVM4_9BACT|nr:tetratricopeptide repeat protein [Neorhodopirellula pilleata]TWU04023.1 photosystem I assembly protein Ycf3 [Neorhodopirellula pilleata]